MLLKETIHSLAKELLPAVIGYRRHIHQHPELSFEESNTSQYIRQYLDELGIPYDYPFAKHGFIARIKGDRPGKTIALRSELDALPITEANDYPYPSKNAGVMHACGHDMHMASLMGTIGILERMRSEIRGEILLIFQPGEERLPGGAKQMMEEGMFRNHTPDLIIAQHVLPEMETGTVGFRPGNYMASGDEIFITVNGKGGHAALPGDVIDPIVIASHLRLKLDETFKKQVPGEYPTILAFGRIIGEGAVNIIPDHVRLEGTFRTMNEKWREEAHQLIRKICDEVALELGGNIELNILKGYPTLFNDVSSTEKAIKLAKEFLGKEKVVPMDMRMTTEDFGWFASSYPAIMYRFGIKPSHQEKPLPVHTPRFKADEEALYTGMSLMSWLAIHLSQ